jgi:flagellar biogenesis protein FliO
LPESRQVRVYHGFGPPQLALPTNFSAVSCDGQNVAARDGVVLVEVASEALIVPVQQ